MKVGIIGAGTMGSGIAQAFAQTEGYEVFLCDINEEFAANGKNRIAKALEKRVAKGKMEQAAADAILAKITTGVKTRRIVSSLPTLLLFPSLKSAQALTDPLSVCISSIPLLL